MSIASAQVADAHRGGRANLALAVGLTWISNPLTLAPTMYAGYRLGW